MKLSDRLETIDCRKDTKARRVSNVAPDRVANVTAEQLEAGMTLEAIEGLNVPAFAYQTQITLHGKLPAFDPAARPGGYKAVFLNGNGSVGIRYGAIDTEKKALISRAARVSSDRWQASNNSTGFAIGRSFYVRDESEREAKKAETLAALRSVPVSRFYGSAYALSLAYGAGYMACADIGAIPAAELWPLIQDLFGVSDLAELEAREAVKQAERDAQSAKWEAEHKENQAKRQAQTEQKRATLGEPLKVHPKAGETFRILDSFSGVVKTIALSGTEKRTFSQVTHENDTPTHPAIHPRKVVKHGWPKALSEGRLFPV